MRALRIITGHQPSQKFPEHLVLVEDLPRVPSGKVRKDVLREQAKTIAAGLPG